MPDLVPFADIAPYFESFTETAWRLETQRGYATDRSSPNWEAALRGEHFGYNSDNPWQRNVRAQTAEGKHFQRVRLVDDPPTEGQLFLLATGNGNVAAGEDIRNMWRAEAEGLELPSYDFWLFDSRVVARFEFDDAGATLGVRLQDDSTEVRAACRARDLAWQHALPTAEFQSQVPSIM